MPGIIVLNVMAAASEGAAKESAGIAALGIDPLAILAQAGTFLLLFFIIKKYALTSIVNALEDRRKTIDKGVRLGIKMEAEHAKLEEQIEKSLQKARAQADQIIDNAKHESAELIKAAEAKAQAKVDTMISDAQAKIKDDVAHARDELKVEILEYVADATEIIIDEKLDDQKDNQLIKRFIEGTND